MLPAADVLPLGALDGDIAIQMVAVDVLYDAISTVLGRVRIFLSNVHGRRNVRQMPFRSGRAPSWALRWNYHRRTQQLLPSREAHTNFDKFYRKNVLPWETYHYLKSCRGVSFVEV